jgi:general secretion pathway protein D
VPATAGISGATPTAPTGAVTTTESRVEFRDVGLKLTLSPTIHLNGEVTIEINFEISNVGAPIAGVSGAALLPPVNTRNLDSFIKVRDGETRLLGGLFQDTETEATQRIPFLGDLPLVGRLFSDVRTDKARTDVLVAITPRLVKTVERPPPEIEQFFSGTGETFGAPVGVPMAPVPAPVPLAPVPFPGAPARPPGAPGEPPR